jgi:hypothetical protein
MSRLHLTIVGLSAWLSLCAVPAFGAETGDSNATYVKLVNAATGKVLAVEDDSTTAGSPAVLAADKGSKDQQWKLEKSDDFYQLTNRQSGLALDVNNWSNDAGNPIVVWDAKSAADQNDNQLWSWDAAQGSGKGVHIKSKSSGLVLDVDEAGKIVQNNADDNAKSQRWLVVDVAGPKTDTGQPKADLSQPKYVKLVNAESGKVLAVEDDSEYAGGRAVLAKDVDNKDKNSKDRQWKLEKDGNYYQVVNRPSGLVLDVSDESTDEDHPIIVWDDKPSADGNDNQRWTWDGNPPTKGKPARLKSKSSGLVLDVDEDGKLVQRSANKGAKSQLWIVENVQP